MFIFNTGFVSNRLIQWWDFKETDLSLAEDFEETNSCSTIYFEAIELEAIELEVIDSYSLLDFEATDSLETR
jgi:hypothetical protein